MNAQSSSENLKKWEFLLERILELIREKGGNYEEKNVINIAGVSNERDNACRM